MPTSSLIGLIQYGKQIEKDPAAATEVAAASTVCRIAS